MATIAIEFGRMTSKKTREVYLLVRQGKTRKRVKTGVKLTESCLENVTNPKVYAIRAQIKRYIVSYQKEADEERARNQPFR